MTRSEFAAFDAVPDPVMAVRDGTILFANAYAERLFRYGRGELVGLAVEALIPDRFRQRHAQLVAGYCSEAPRVLAINFNAAG